MVPSSNIEAGIEAAIETKSARPSFLNATEARVLACLMEKELTVPDNYPLTLNSLTMACNQKSNREPVVHLAEGEIGHTAKALADRDLIKIEYGDRAHRFEHNIRKMLSLNKSEQALLSVMMLRAPQTLNELKVRTRRMSEFSGHDEIMQAIEHMNERDSALIQHIPKGPGQREDRYTHLLCGEVELSQSHQAAALVPPPEEDKLSTLEARVTALEARIVALESGEVG